MKSKRSRIGSKKWKHSVHKSKEWYIKEMGIAGISKWQRNGK